jgi:hypothetical protein
MAGDLARARELYDEIIALKRRLGNEQMLCAAERGELPKADEQVRRAEELLDQAGLVLDPADRLEYDRTVELARAPERRCPGTVPRLADVDTAEM